MALLPPGAPLVLADGTVIDPKTGAATKETRSLKVVAPVKSVGEKILIRDLPLSPERMNVVGLVLFYSIYGLNDIGIAEILSLTTDQIRDLKDSDVYKSEYDRLVSRIQGQLAEGVDGYLQSQAHTAANKLAELVHDEDATIAMQASKDILDRTGHSSKSKGGGGMTGLVIHLIEPSSASVKTSPVTLEG